MRKMFARLVEVKIKNGKSVASGNIVFNDVKKFNPEELSSYPTVFGIYGQNRSGKSTAVEAIAIAHDLISGRKASLINNGFITEWENLCECSYVFIIQTSANSFWKYEYSITFKKNDNDDSDRPYVLEHESLIVKSCFRNENGTSWKNIIPAIGVSFSSPKSIFDEVQYKKRFSKIESLGETKTLSKNDLKSFLFSKEFIGGCSKTHQDKLARVLTVLKEYCTFDLFVFSNDESSLAMINYISLCDRNETDNEIGAGKIRIDINQVSEISSERYEIIERCIEDMNVVLPSIITNFQLTHKNRGEYTNDKGVLMTKFEVFSVVGGVEIPLRCESAGVKKIVAICSVLIDVFNDPSVCLVVDEMDSGVFEYLLGQIIKVFDNYAKGQIVFTAHNSRALECLPTKQIIFTTTNPNKKYIRLKKVKPTNNLRDFYFRAIVLGGQDEELYNATSESKIAKSFGFLRRKSNDK